ncbi:hypothetical protein [Gymnodinialimonas sp. 57CJ19]|uniref:hypothetical protein n=1 Tax=Gymnodinialimonas sp. 57CJ19 TaxID=3138498 RepID=UPI003134638F
MCGTVAFLYGALLRVREAIRDVLRQHKNRPIRLKLPIFSGASVDFTNDGRKFALGSDIVGASG